MHKLNQTTLLDVLAQRKTEGEISGAIHVDGRVLPLAFQRSAGYCEQADVHEPLATVREALEFSAILRQPKETSHADKIAYVDTIINLLGMSDIEHALVGRPGNGLNVEQRKRLTIGVELVAKPSILLFLDEPTSALDSQSAFSIVKFLRKLADAGQAGQSGDITLVAVWSSTNVTSTYSLGNYPPTECFPFLRIRQSPFVSQGR